MPRAARGGRRSANGPSTLVPVLTPPEERASVGGLYATKLVFEFLVLIRGTPGKRRLCEERLVLVTAPTARSALREANRQGRASQYRYRNSAGNPVHFRFVGVADLLHLGVECEPNEVWYTITERVRPMERRRKLVPKAEELNAIREEVVLSGGRRRRLH